MATKKPETKLQEAIQKALRARGAYVVKVHGGVYQPDALDLIVCYRGQFVSLESKELGNDATPRQAKRMREISVAGGRASVAFSVEDALRVLGDIDAEVEAWMRFRAWQAHAGRHP